ncbi:MAG: hypothetical protein HWQ35_15070 [Nostoc sp. NMS1]|uniref:hypothetical protein n=1 Tax=unclassified Nostoc TaxID=2593658 RepID=UPI0025E27864|nr:MULTISPECIES: hypothetical protein [unclassified Nostoc]MBN3907827.1 hypothetical protein [Nostoc sp. NMS1]MBN3991162.1 hypothetical protein [Nostoc sp. NMS2]
MTNNPEQVISAIIAIANPVDMSRVYLYAMRRKMERDIKSDRTFTSWAETAAALKRFIIVGEIGGDFW